MGQIQNPKRIRAEDFPQDQQEFAKVLGGLINIFLEEVYNLTNGNVDFYNLNQELIDVDIDVDSSGSISNDAKFKTNVTSSIKGINCVRAENLRDTSIYPVSQPFVSFTPNDNIITINNVSGLQNGSKYRLTLHILT